MNNIKLNKYYIIIFIIVLLFYFINKYFIKFNPKAIINFRENYKNIINTKKTTINNIGILLTCTVNINNNIRQLVLRNSETRKNIYIKSIRQWLEKTNFPIVVVDNSNYNFPELNIEKELYKGRFEIISFDGTTKKHCEKIIEKDSKGIYELFSIIYAYENSFLLRNLDYIIKVTGRYFIPNLEDNLSIMDQNMYKIIQQRNPNRCEIIGVHKSIFKTIFDMNNVHSHIEYTYRNRLDKYKNEKWILPTLQIEPTINGGFGKYVSEL